MAAALYSACTTGHQPQGVRLHDWVQCTSSWRLHDWVQQLASVCKHERCQPCHSLLCGSAPYIMHSSCLNTHLQDTVISAVSCKSVSLCPIAHTCSLMAIRKTYEIARVACVIHYGAAACYVRLRASSARFPGNSHVVSRWGSRCFVCLVSRYSC
jgi:hypothetical protein